MNNKVIFILVFAVFFPLIGILITVNSIDENAVSVQTISPDIISEYRGKDYRDVAYSNGQHVWTGGLEEWTYDEERKTYVREKITDDGIIIKIDSKQFPYIFDRIACSGKLYNNDRLLSENPDVLIGKDTWTLNYKKVSDSIWTEADLSSFTCNTSISTNSSGWFLTVLREKSNVASLEIIYAKRENQPLETFSIITNNNPTWDSYQFTTNNKLENVAAEKFFIDGKEATESNLFMPYQISSNIIQFDSSNDKFMLDITKAKNQFSGVRKIGNMDYVLEFENNPAMLKTGQKVIIDPTYGYTGGTWTYVHTTTGPSSSCGSGTTISTTPNIGRHSSSSGGWCASGVQDFDISTIPDTATITDVVVRIDTSNNENAENCDFTEVDENPSTASASNLWEDITATGSDSSPTKYITSDVCSAGGAGTDRVVDLGSTANVKLKNTYLSTNHFYVGLAPSTLSRDSSHHFTDIITPSTGFELQVTYNDGSQITIDANESDITTAITTGSVLQKNSSDTRIISLNSTGHAKFTGLYGLQNFTLKETTDNFVVKKTYNLNATLVGNSTQIMNGNIFRVDCSANGSGVDLILKVNETDGHRISSFGTPTCDGTDDITWSVTFTRNGNSGTSYDSKMIATILNTQSFDQNADYFTVDSSPVTTTYSSGKINSINFNIGTGMTTVTKNFKLFLSHSGSTSTNQTAEKSFVLVATADLSKQKNNLGTNYTDVYNGSFEPDFNLINFTGYSKVRILSGWDYNTGDTGSQQTRWVDANNSTRILYETSSITVDQDPNDSGWISLPAWAKNETTIEWQGKSTVNADDPIAKYFRIFLR